MISRRVSLPRAAAAALSVVSVFASGVQAQTSLKGAIDAGMPIIDVRLRFEAVEQANRPKTAEATTIRARLGYQTGVFYGVSGLAEFDIVQHLGGEAFNDTINGRLEYPIVADPDQIALNRLHLTYAARLTDAAAANNMPDMRITLGRQRIIFGNARFIGTVGWRQHEQTYDSVLLANTSLPGTTLSYAYVARVNRVFGERAPAGRFDSHSHLFNAVYAGLLPRLRLEGYGYLLDLRQAPALSTQTFGLRAEGAFDAVGARLFVNGAYAHQAEYAKNPLDIDLNYFLAEAGATWMGATALVGWEVLEGNGVIGFSTPLATLHAFQGWADVFLTTPVNGIEDLYVSASYGMAAAPWFDKVTGTLVYHDYHAERLSTSYGNEWNALLEANIDANVLVGAKYADFNGSTLFPDRQIVWLYASYRY